MTKAHYSTRQAASKIKVSFRTLNRWIASGRIKASHGVTLADGRRLWYWNDADIAKGKNIKATLKPGRKAKVKK